MVLRVLQTLQCFTPCLPSSLPQCTRSSRSLASSALTLPSLPWSLVTLGELDVGNSGLKIGPPLVYAVQWVAPSPTLKWNFDRADPIQTAT